MPEAPLKFGNSQNSGHEELAGASPVAVNAVVDATGAVRRRPGLSASTLAPPTVVDARGFIGLHRSPTGLLLGVAGTTTGPASLYRITASGFSTLSSALYLSQRPSWAETEAIVVLAGGHRPRRVDLASPYAFADLGGNPPKGTQVVAHNGRLLLTDPDVNGRIWYSAPAAGSSTSGHEQWTAGVTALGRSGFFAAEARPDALVAIAENTNELFAFGQTNLQLFAPDGTFIYSPVSAREFGCAAAASLIRDEQSFAWLDERRRFVYSDGRTITPISDPIKATLDALTRVDDCHGYRVLQGPVDCLVWTFPTDGVTLAMQKGGGWSQWHGWSDTANNYTPFRVSASAAVIDSGETLAGTTDGYVAKFDSSAATDLGTRIPYSVTTGFNNQGTDARKNCKALRLVLRRGSATGTEPVVQVAWRDDLGPWGDPIRVGLGTVGDYESVVDLRSLGAYRRRQWRLAFHGTSEFVLASATETFEVMEY
jgi:hypothetical protein